jgi:hypothetical protein
MSRLLWTAELWAQRDAPGFMHEASVEKPCVSSTGVERSQAVGRRL